MMRHLAVSRPLAGALAFVTSASLAWAQNVPPAPGSAKGPPLPPGPPPASSGLVQEAAPGGAPPAPPPAPPSPQGPPPPVYYSAGAPPPGPGYPSGQYQAPLYYPAPPAPPATEASRGAYLHDGFYLRMGLGVGRLGASLKSNDSTELGGSVDGSIAHVAGAFEFAVGGTPAPGLVIGGGLFGSQSRDVSTSDLTVSGQKVHGLDFDQLSLTLLGPFVDYYFNEKAGFHLQGALGIAFVHSSRGFQDGKRTTDDRDMGGLGFMLGGGYEWFIAEQWSLGGTLRMTYGAVETDRSDDERWSYSVLAIPEILFTATYH
jgi:hypothetical protein